MKVGKYTVDIINEGTILKDGGIEFAGMPKKEWEEIITPDENNKILFGSNILLIRGPKINILVDTGLGTKKNESVSMDDLLNPYGIDTSDINYVVLTHLHREHCGGSTKQVGEDVVPTFKNACYIIQKEEWDSVLLPNVNAAEHGAKNYLPLLERGQIKLINGNIELVPGVFVEITGGHTVGHQIVIIEDSIEDVIYFGDICPTSLHLSTIRHEAFDFSPLETVTMREKLLCKAVQNNCLVVFPHDLKGKFYRVFEDNNQFKAVEA